MPVPIVEGTAEGGDIDPSKMSHDDIREIARLYQAAVGEVTELRRLLDDANVVIMRLQENLREAQNNQRDHHQANEKLVGHNR